MSTRSKETVFLQFISTNSRPVSGRTMRWHIILVVCSLSAILNHSEAASLVSSLRQLINSLTTREEHADGDGRHRDATQKFKNATKLGNDLLKTCVPSEDEINGYQGVVNDIIELAVTGKAKDEAYNRLALFTDTFGNRIAGSQNLENAIDYMLNALTKDGLENVHSEPVMVPHWVRGEESLEMIHPRQHKMALLGLGSSIGTPSGGITAEVLVVSSFDELHSRASDARGKIVVFNEKWISYGVTVAYRSRAAMETSKVGGLASLVRSVTPFSINSPHTGWQDYSDNVKKIPTACITVEDAEMMKRMSDRGTKIMLHLEMGAKNLPMVKSRNTVAEIVGSKYPDQVVLVSGHLDSWDVGAGAMDDGGGAFISWQVLSLLKQLGLRPKRTVRLVMWTGEDVVKLKNDLIDGIRVLQEEGGFGGQAYYEAHKKNISNFDLVMESDAGTFAPIGIDFGGNKDATNIMKNILGLLKSVNATQLKQGVDETDIASWAHSGVPGAGLRVKGFQERYFYFHHTNGDTMSVLDPHELNLCSAFWTAVAYVVADLECMLPR